jgi:TIR domain/NB-ARC domain
MRKAKRNRSDFFIDYADADAGWAEWVAWQLEDAGYTVVYRARDFGKGLDVVKKTDEEVQRAERVMLLLSPAYLRVHEAQKISSMPVSGVSVWTTAFMQSGKLLPLRVRACQLKGLLQPLIPIELADQNEMQARKLLLDGVSRELPIKGEKPPFPGDAQPERDRPVFPATSRPAFWAVPSENPFFTDRDDELTRLYELLHEGLDIRKHEGPRIRKYVINGLGGVGKTQVALAYAHEYKYRYQAVLWVDASNERMLEASTSRLLGVLKLRLVGQQRRNKQNMERAVKRWLEEHENWLLIFDDIEDIQSVREMLPTSGNGYVLYTARTQIIGAAASAALPLTTLKSEDGALFLLRRTRQIQLDETLEHLSEQHRTEALKLSRLLGDLPLMLDQAGACIEDTGLDVANYLEWYSNAEGRHSLLRRRGDVTVDHPESVVETWDAAFAAVQQTNPATYDLLRLCAFLYQDAIPEEIINKGAVELLPTFQAFAQPSPRAEVFSALRRYSLLTQDMSSRTLSMNCMVQEVLKDKMSGDERRLWAERAIIAVARALLDSVQSDGPMPGWQRCPRYIHYVHVCTLHMQGWSLAPTEAVSLLSAMGKYLHDYVQAQHEAPESIERAHLIGTLEGYAVMLEKMNQRAEAGEIMGYVATIRPINQGRDRIYPVQRFIALAGDEPRPQARRDAARR